MRARRFGMPVKGSRRRPFEQLGVLGLASTDVACVRHDAVDIGIVEQVALDGFEPVPGPGAVAHPELDRRQLRAGVRRARQQVVACLQIAEMDQVPFPGSFEIAGFVAEGVVHRRTAIGEDPARVAHQHDVAQAREQCPQSCLVPVPGEWRYGPAVPSSS